METMSNNVTFRYKSPSDLSSGTKNLTYVNNLSKSKLDGKISMFVGIDILPASCVVVQYISWLN
jgi:hypothetical protein